jgi:DNA-binding FrmR family transcriptional regulator
MILYTLAGYIGMHDCSNDKRNSGCHSDSVNGRHALAVDPEIKSSNLKRLRRIEGQIRGIAKMVEEEKYCADILVQISAVQEALRSVGRELMRNHLRHCAATAIQSGSDEDARAMYDELLDLMYKYSR